MTKILSLITGMCILFLHISAAPFSVPPISKLDSGGISCTAPYIGVLLSANGTASVRWFVDAYPSDYQIQYHVAGDTSWSATAQIKVSSRDSNFFTLKNFKTCTKYEVRVRKICAINQFSSWTVSSFLSGGCPPPCYTPYDLSVSYTDTSATFKWSTYASDSFSTVQWKKNDDLLWQDASVKNNKTFKINGLKSCTVYTFRIKSNCSTSSSSEFISKEFKTAGCITSCPIPSHLYYSNSNGKTSVHWTSTGDLHCDFQYRIAPDSNWVDTVIKSNNYFNLPATGNCDNYQVRVRSLCNSISSPVFVPISEWSSVLNFKTQNCTTQCQAPIGINASSTSNSAYISWNTEQGSIIKFYSLEWTTLADTSKHNVVTGITNISTILNNLTANTAYQVRIRVQCPDGNQGVWSPFVSFKTKSITTVCLKPLKYKVQEQDSTVKFSWTMATGTGKIILWILSKDSTYNKTFVLTDSTYTATLPACKSYTARFKTQCTDNLSSEFTEPLYFAHMTSACSNGVSNSGSTNGSDTTHRIVPSTNCNAPQNVQTVLTQDTVINISWSTVAGASRYEVLLSLSKDAAVSPKSTIAAQPKIILSGLKNCTSYYVTVRAICDTVPGKWSVVNTFVTGHCIKNVCAVPTLIVQSSDTASISLKISNTGAQKYYINYRDAADSLSANLGWKHDSMINSEKIISGLRACHTYYVQATAVCGSALSIPSVSVKVNTICPTLSVCDVLPENLSVIPTDTSAVLSWLQGTNSGLYNVRIHATSGDTTWKTININQSGLTVNGLNRCTSYQWEVRKVCTGDKHGPWSAPNTFSTIGCTEPLNNVSALIAGNTILQDFSVAPNPGTDYMEIGYTLKLKAELSIDIFNWQGQIVKSRHLGIQDPAYYVQKYDDVITLPTGLYLISVNANGRILTTQKWLKLE